MSSVIYPYEKHPVVVYRMAFLEKCITRDQSVVDLGCGYGFISFLIADFAKEVVGIDQNELSIQRAKSAYVKDNLKYYARDAATFLKENNRRFDVLILSHILEHIDNPKEFLLQYTKYFSYVYIELPDYQGTILNEFRADQNMSLIYTDGDHVTEFDRQELRAIFSDCGITEMKSEFIFGVQRYWCRFS